jgi:hypothetical protein
MIKKAIYSQDMTNPIGGRFHFRKTIISKTIQGK